MPTDEGTDIEEDSGEDDVVPEGEAPAEDDGSPPE
jgi:hypothetical protein